MCNSCPSLPKKKKIPNKPTPGLTRGRAVRAAIPRPGAEQRRSHAAEVSPRSLGRSVRHRFGARHHGICTANCCFSCHSTKGASWSPPRPRASIGSRGGAESRTDALLLDRRPVNQLKGCATPASLGGPVRTAGPPSYTHPYTQTHTRLHALPHKLGLK